MGICLQVAAGRFGKRFGLGSMPMAMMDVRKMGVVMGQDRMPVLMAVRLAAIPVEMLVPVMHVVNVWLSSSGSCCAHARDARSDAAKRLTAQ